MRTAFTPVAAAGLLLVCSGALADIAVPHEPPSHPSRVMVRLHAGADAHAAAAAVGGKVMRTYRFVPGLVCIEVPEGSTRGAIQTLLADAGVMYAEHDYMRSTSAQDTPYGVTMVKAQDCWTDAGGSAAARGSGATVAVLDTGIDLTHPDLPPPVLSISFVNGETVDDLHSHGTHCAGTIGAVDNTVGVIGVAPSVNLMAGKVLSNSGWGSDSDVQAGVEWAADNGADVISMSLGGSGYSQSFADIVAAVVGSGVTIVAAAGNDNSGNPHYPSSYPGVISVAAVDSNMERAGFSNYGSWISVAAPGVSVQSTVPLITTSATWNNTGHGANRLGRSRVADAVGSIYYCDDGMDASDFPAQVSGNIAHIRRGNGGFQEKVDNAEAAGAIGVIISNNNGGLFSGNLTNGSFLPVVAISQSNGDELQNTFNGSAGSITFTQTGHTYAGFSGTSMACPHVAAVAGLMYSNFGSALTPALLRTAMESTALDLGDAGRDDFFGHGLVNAQATYAYLLANTGGGCDSIDFNGDGLFPDNQDLEDFFNVFGGGACSTGDCNDVDFNNDGLFPDNEDLETYLRVFGGGNC
ncbi:MAG TPA: S8 family serine peptidase [Phycisphaerales bacterium]|nr:S8 family serine peptidase [Phycisphaerales bacterium]